MSAVSQLRLPATVAACLFDLDGVLTQTATLHEIAWKETFDTFLRERGEPFEPFEQRDYDLYVDGKERNDGVRSFLAARGIALSDREMRALGDRKHAAALELIHARGAHVYEDAAALLRAVKAAGLGVAVVSSSTNCREILVAAGIEQVFDVRVDALVAAARGLAGKPAPDMFLEAARELGVAPPYAAVFEDALAGVAAGRAGGFSPVVGVDRVGQAEALRAGGADIVVQSLAELLG